MDNYYLTSCENNRNETDKLKEKVKKLEKLENKYLKSLNETRLGFKRNNSGGIYYSKMDMTPMNNLESNEKNNRVSSQKKNKKTIAKNLFKSYDGKNDNDENQENDGEKIIKVEKKIGVNENN